MEDTYGGIQVLYSDLDVPIFNWLMVYILMGRRACLPNRYMDISGCLNIKSYITLWVIYIIRLLYLLTFSSFHGNDPLQCLLGFVHTDIRNMPDTPFISQHSNSPYKNTNYITFKPVGRLGNLMYEYSSLIGIAQKNGMSPCVPRHIGIYRCFNITRYPVHTSMSGKVYHPSDLQFEEESFHIHDNVSHLEGVLQSWKYFGHVDEIIRKEFNLFPKYEQFSSSLVRGLANKMKEIPTFVCVQVRRGDFVNRYSHLINPITTSYINRAMAMFEKTFSSVQFVVVTDDPAWCKQHLPLLDKHMFLSEGHTDCEDMSLLMNCNHSIITAGSSFGWWGAYLARGHVTYFPGWLKRGSWYNLKINEDDFYPPHTTAVDRVGS